MCSDSHIHVMASRKRAWLRLLLITFFFSSGNTFFNQPLVAQVPNTVELLPNTSPSAAQPGVTVVSLTGSGFPGGSIVPGQVTISLQVAPGYSGPKLTASAIAVAVLAASSRRITFQIAGQNVTAPTPYLVSVSGSTSTGNTFVSSNAASLTIEPSAALAPLSPAVGRVGQVLSVAIAGQFTNFLQNGTQASFGPGIVVGTGPVGGFGPVTVTSPTTAMAQLTINANAAPGLRNVTVATGIQQATLTGGFTVTPATLTSITVTPANPSISKGGTQQFTATGTYSDSSTANLTGQVTWTSGTPARATITGAGLATGVAAGTSTITATLGSVSGSTLLTVTPATLTSITVTPANPSISKGGTQQFTATGTYSDSTTANLTGQVTWTSGTPAKATITGAGLATGVAAGTSTITATLGSVSGSTVLTVTPATLTSIQVTPANPSISKGGTQQFTATGTYSDSSTANITGQVTWTSGTPAKATITGAGLATGVAAGTSTITATLGSVSGSTVLTVTPATLTSITVTPVNPSISKGGTQQFTATGTYSDSSTANITGQVTWTSGTPAKATITGAGLATGVAAGTSTITATLGSVSGSTVLTVTPATLTSITVTPANPSISKGGTQQFTATGTYSDSSTANLTGQVTWTSGTPAKATITGAGLATGVAAGTSTITATLGSVSGSTVLTVTQATLTSIQVTPLNPSISKGGTQQFTATGTYSDSSTANITGQVTWTSGTPAKATITGAGLATGVAAGTSTITATLGSVSGSTVLTVTPATLTSIQVTPSNPSISKGGTQQFTATGTYSDSTTANLTGQVTWTSGTPAKATITGAGLATGVAAGTSTITATLGSVSGSTVLTVTPATPRSVTYTYDSQGRLASVTYTSAAGSVTVTYSYDSAGNRTSVVTR